MIILMVLIAIILGVLGAIFGSFVDALTWRLHEKKDWVRGRSQCEHCGHTLSAADLVPVLSWLTLAGRCRYCKKPISIQSPLVEIGLSATFVLSYVFWPHDFISYGDKALFIAWLAAAVGLAALFVYDLRWMILPSRLIYPILAVTALGNVVFLAQASGKASFLFNWLAAVVIASGIFFILHLVSEGRWIGFGDVRLGLATGTLLRRPELSLLMIFLASIIGTIIVLPSMVRGKRGIGSRLPFGPYLILATALCVIFGQHILDWYLNLVSLNPK